MSRIYKGKLQAIIFDWAGTTVDYGCFAPVAVFIEVFKQQGIEITIPQARAPMGLEKRDHIRAISQMPEILKASQAVHQSSPSEDDIERMYLASVKLQEKVVSHFAELVPNTVETITVCRQRGLKIGSSTGYSQTIMDALVPAAAAQGYCPDAILSPSDVPVGRPAPYMMYENAIRLNVYPMAAIVKVGDTLPDIEEGLNAGSWVVSVSESGNELGLSKEEVQTLAADELNSRLESIEARFLEVGAHYVIRTIADLPPILDAIEARLQNGEQP